MASSNHEVMVILSDGKPVTVIKTKDDHAAAGKVNRATERNLSFESPHKNNKENQSVNSLSKQEKELSKHKAADEHVEFRRLRSENQLLQERITHMEEFMAVEKQEKEECLEHLKKQISEMAENERSSRTRIQHLLAKIEELQIVQEAQLSDPVNVEVQIVQDELVASKLREAEAKSSFKELQQKLHHLEKQWQLYLQDAKTGKGGGREGESDNNKGRNQIQSELKEQVMALRIRETSLVSELDENKQKLMELETQNHVFERQTKRQDNENNKLLEQIVGEEAKANELYNTIKILERKLCDLESKQKEDRVMFKIREAEFCQNVAELKRRIAELEIENQELLTSAQLLNKDQDVKEMENRIIELQEEILQMKFQTSDSVTAEGLHPPSIMTESFLGDVCLQPTNFDSIVDFPEDYLSQTKELLDLNNDK